MANEEEMKTKKTAKEPVEINPDPDIISAAYFERNPKKILNKDDT